MRNIRKLALVFFVFLASFVMSEKRVLAAKDAPIIQTVEAYQERNGEQCGVFTGCVVAGEDITVNLDGVAYSSGNPLKDGDKVGILMKGGGILNCGYWPLSGVNLFSFTVGGASFQFKQVELSGGSATVTIPGSYVREGCAYEIVVRVSANQEDGDNEVNKTVISTTTASSESCSLNQCSASLNSSSVYDLCAQQIDTSTDEYESCVECAANDGVWTAIGCIPTNPESVVQTIITIGITIGGAVVLIMILVGAFMLSTSQGDPNKTKEAKEIITSAIIGLLFVIFSVAILQFIGVNILKIPGFGE